MANKTSVLQILIKVLGGKASEKEVSTLKKSLGGLKGALGSLGLALGAKELLDFSQYTEAASRELKDARNALISVVGGMSQYQQTIDEVKAATNSMVSETEAAQSVFGLLDNKIAKTAEEAANYVLAGQAFEAALGQTASFEKFLMLLDEGSDMLLNNFNITGSAVEQRQRLIETNTNLEGSEAKLQAIRELALEKGLALSNTISDETEAARQFEAASQDLAAAIGDLLAPAFEQAKVSGTSFFQTLTDGLGQLAEAQDTNAKVADKLGITYEQLASDIITGRITSEEYEAALAEVNREMGRHEVEAQRAAAAVSYYTGLAEQAAQAEADLAAALARGNQAWGERYTAMAGYYQKFGGVDVDYGATTPDQAIAEQAQKEKAAAAEQEKNLQEQVKNISSAFNELSSQISGAVSSAVGRIQEVMPDLFGTIEDPGEFGRRMGALADGLQDSDKVFLEKFKQQAGGNPLYAALLQAIEEGDSTGVAAEANKLLSENMAQIIATGLAEQIKAESELQKVMQEAEQIVAAELGQPLENTQENIASAAATTTTEMGNVQAAGSTAASTIKTEFGAAKEPVEILNERLKITASLLREIVELSGKATSGIGAMNVPGSANMKQPPTGL